MLHHKYQFSYDLQKTDPSFEIRLQKKLWNGFSAKEETDPFNASKSKRIPRNVSCFNILLFNS